MKKLPDHLKKKRILITISPLLLEALKMHPKPTSQMIELAVKEYLKLKF